MVGPRPQFSGYNSASYLSTLKCGFLCALCYLSLRLLLFEKTTMPPSDLKSVMCKSWNAQCSFIVYPVWNDTRIFYKKPRIWPSTESFLKLSDFGYSEFLTSFLKMP